MPLFYFLFPILAISGGSLGPLGMAFKRGWIRQLQICQEGCHKKLIFSSSKIQQEPIHTHYVNSTVVGQAHSRIQHREREKSRRLQLWDENVGEWPSQARRGCRKSREDGSNDGELGSRVPVVGSVPGRGQVVLSKREELLNTDGVSE